MTDLFICVLGLMSTPPPPPTNMCFVTGVAVPPTKKQAVERKICSNSSDHESWSKKASSSGSDFVLRNSGRSGSRSKSSGAIGSRGKKSNCSSSNLMVVPPVAVGVVAPQVLMQGYCIVPILIVTWYMWYRQLCFVEYSCMPLLICAVLNEWVSLGRLQCCSELHLRPCCPHQLPPQVLCLRALTPRVNHSSVLLLSLCQPPLPLFVQ